MRRVQSLEPLRGWLPAVVSIMGVAYGVTVLRGIHQLNQGGVARTTPARRRVLPVVALNLSSLALVLIGSRIHGHWFVRVIRHCPTQSILIAGQFSCQPLWRDTDKEQESAALSATAY